MSKNKGFTIPKDDICYEEDVEEIEFLDYIPPSKNCTSIFKFTNDDTSKLVQPTYSNNTNESTCELVHPSYSNDSNESTSKLVHPKHKSNLNQCNNKLVHPNQPISMNQSNNKITNNISNTSTLTPNLDIFDNRTLPFANGSAPSINGEKPTLKRTYKLRPTTIKKLNELIAIHSDPNTYVSTIVDIAIEFYYDFIKNEKLNN